MEYASRQVDVEYPRNLEDQTSLDLESNEFLEVRAELIDRYAVSGKAPVTVRSWIVLLHPIGTLLL